MPDLLTPKQLAEYLQLSQRTVYRMLERDQIPALKVGGQWRFRKSAVDYWLDLKMHQLDSAELQEIQAPRTSPALTLREHLAPPNALIAVTPGSVPEVVGAFVEQVTFPEPVDVPAITGRILKREALCSTALPEGVALLHTSRWEPRALAHNLVAIGRLPAAIDFDALDHSRVDLLFLLLARDERDHLVLQAKASRLCREPAFLESLRAAGGPVAVLALVDETERRVFGGGAP